MHSLENIQEKIQKAILGEETQLDFIKQKSPISTQDRITVHRDTVFENFITNLQIIYPGIWKLIGKDCAKGVALAYSHDFNNLTNRSQIGDFGANFPEFLSKFPSTKHLQYLPDYARLEWLKSKSYEAHNYEAIKIEELQSFFQGDIESYKLILNPSIFLFESRFPLMNIQELLENKDIDNLDLYETQCCIIVCRVQGKIETLYVENNQWSFLQAIHKGDLISDAMEVFSQEDMIDEITQIIHLMINKQMIIRIVK